MLANIIFGDHACVSHEWTVVSDKYGNAFLTNESIGQKIRLGQKVEPKLEKCESQNRVVTYNIPENIFISNNNKNMNVSIFNYWDKDKDNSEKNTTEEKKIEATDNESEEEVEERRDDDILYITLMNANYKLLSYQTNCPIVQTYKKRDVFNGLAIVVDKNVEHYNSHNIFTMNVRDLKNKNFVTIAVDVSKHGKVNTFVYPIEDRNVVKTCKELYKKLGEKTMSFTINCGKFPTATFIVDKNKVEELKAKLVDYDIPNINFIEVDKDAFSEKKTNEEKKKLNKLIVEKIVNARVRAVTTVGVRTPFEFCKQYKVLYLFSHDLDKDITKCLKSN